MCVVPEAGVWLDDPPSLVLKPGYLEQLFELPLGHVAVMLDGPEPGLADANWSGAQLAFLARRLDTLAPTIERVLTAWAAPTREAIVEQGERLPALLDALRTRSLEMDVEPAGDWRESDVLGFKDEDRDGRVLDEATDALVEMLLSLDLDAIETTTFPSALRIVVPIMEGLARFAPRSIALRYYGQHYAVAKRKDQSVPFNGALGPIRFPRESHEAAVKRLPERVEVCAGLAAYRTRWEAHGDSMGASLASASGAGARKARYWSAKHLVRLRGAAARRSTLAALLAA